MQPSLGMGSGFKSFNREDKKVILPLGCIKAQVLHFDLFHTDPLQPHVQSEHNCSVHRHIAYRANDRDFSYSSLQSTKTI